MCHFFFPIDALYTYSEKLPNLSYYLEVGSSYFTPSWVFFLEDFEDTGEVKSTVLDVYIWYW